MNHDGDRKRAGKVVAVANQKGGVGKTTTAVNLGAGIACAGYRCLLIDIDPQGNASTGLGSFSDERDQTAYEVLVDETPVSSATVSTPLDRLELLPGSIDLSGIDVEFADMASPAFRLRDLITGDPKGDLRAQYDYIIIDCPPSLNLLTINAIAAANSVVVPLQSEFFALEGLTQLLATVRQVRESLNPALKIHGIVLTMYDQRNRLSAQVAHDVRSNLGDVVYKTVIPRNVRLSEAPSHALPALLYDPSCAGSKAYLQLTAEFLQRDGLTVLAEGT